MVFRSSRRPAKAALLLLAAFVLLAGLLAVPVWRSLHRDPGAAEPLIVYCAAGLKAPVEAVAKDYQEKYGVPIQLQYGGSQTLLANIEISKQGDLYLPADDSYLDIARSRQLIDETIPLAEMAPTLAVKKGNPKNVHSLSDLIDGKAVVAQANPDAAAIGKVTRAALKKSGHWTALEKRTAVFKPTVNDVANDIVLGSADAGFVWDALVRQYADLEAVALPELAGVTSHLSIAVLQSSDSTDGSAAALPVISAARDRGLDQLRAQRFQARARRSLVGKAGNPPPGRLHASSRHRANHCRLREARGRPGHPRLQRLRHPGRSDARRRASRCLFRLR